MLSDSGKLVMAGPFQNGGNYRGLLIFDVETIDEAPPPTGSALPTELCFGKGKVWEGGKWGLRERGQHEPDDPPFRLSMKYSA